MKNKMPTAVMGLTFSDEKKTGVKHELEVIGKLHPNGMREQISKPEMETFQILNILQHFYSWMKLSCTIQLFPPIPKGNDSTLPNASHLLVSPDPY